jgi:hypothetical protein
MPLDSQDRVLIIITVIITHDAFPVVGPRLLTRRGLCHAVLS